MPDLGLTAVAGYFDCGNFGDDWLYEAWKSARGPSQGVISWRRAFPKFERWNELREVVFLGGLLQDFTSTRSLIYYLGCAELAARLSPCPIVFEGASVGPLIRPLSKRMVARFLKGPGRGRAEFFLRDRASLELLSGLDGEIAGDIHPDPTWSSPLPIDYESIKKSNAAGLGLLLNGSLVSEAFLNCLARLSVEGGPKVTLFLSDPDRDRWQARWLMKRCARLMPMVEYQADTGLFIRQLAGCRALVSFRLHGAIAGMKLGLPVACGRAAGTGLALEKLRTLVLPAGAHFQWFEQEENLVSWLKEVRLTGSSGNFVLKVLS